MPREEAEERFWDFALRAYGREAAQTAFLRLQDRDGADVPMLLWCLWLGAEGIAVSRAEMIEAVAFSAAWRAAAVVPLRTLRRDLKSGIAGAPIDLSDEARGMIAKTEQAVEKLQMDFLARVPEMPLAARAPQPDSEMAAAALALYAEVAEVTLDPADTALIGS